MTHTEITLFGVLIYSPTTAFTDFALTAMYAGFAWTLRGARPEHVRHWRLAFVFGGLSTLILGVRHAVKYLEADHAGVYYAAWLVAQAAAVLNVYFVQRATLASVLATSARKALWQHVCTAQLAIALLAVLVLQSFAIVYVDSLLGFTPIIVAHARAPAPWRGGPLIALGIGSWFAALVVWSLRLSAGPYFNHLDFAHVVLMAGLGALFAGVRRNATVPA